MPVINKEKGIFTFLGYIIFSVNILSILLLFMGYLSWHVSPQKMIVFAYAGFAFPVVLAINIVFVFFWLIFRKWKYMLITIGALLLCSKPVTAYFPLNIKKKEIPEGCIKFLSYNVMCFGWHNDRNNPNEENDIIEYIRNSGADIVCLQEHMSIYNHKKSSSKNIQKRLEHYPYYSEIQQRPELGHFYGVACFSKYPIIEAVELPYKSENGSALFKLNINGKIISIINNHLESNGLAEKDRKLYRDFFEERGKVKIDDIAHNMKSKLGTAFRVRAPQAEVIDSCIRSQNTDGIIVCGDFNDTPVSYAYHKIKGDLIDAYAENEFGPRITYHENNFLFRIDFIMHSKNIKSYNCTIDKVKYSDHYPIWSYLKID